MSASARNLATKPAPSSVLTKAVARAAERLDISRALLAKILAHLCHFSDSLGPFSGVSGCFYWVSSDKSFVVP